jgi:O-acetyl-ADP-ribose deacetylase (regulator of RNase III)
MADLSATTTARGPVAKEVLKYHALTTVCASVLPATLSSPPSSIAFPAIATGVYGFPGAQAARIAIDTIRSAATAVGTVYLVAFDEDTYDMLTTALHDETM